MNRVILCTGGYDHTIKFWESSTCLCRRTIQYPDSQVNVMCITPTKQYLSVGGNPHVKLYDINGNDSTPVTSFNGHSNNVTAMGFQNDMRWMFTSSEDKTVKIWDLRGKGTTRILTNSTGVNTAELHPNQSELISGDQNGNIVLWDIGKEQKVETLVPDGKVPIRSLSLSKDGSTLVAVNNSGKCFVWGVDEEGDNLKNKQSQNQQQQQQKQQQSQQTQTKGSNINEEKKTETETENEQEKENEIEIEKENKQENVQQSTTKQRMVSREKSRFKLKATINAHETYILKCLISPNSKLIATTSADKTIKVWNLDDQFSLSQTLTGHTRWVWSCVFSHDSNYLISVSSDHVARLWDLQKGETVIHYSGHHKALTSIALCDY
ncbi:target of rapamycin complex subunit lst8 [Anaeramoeba flamelloides]|uniref:Target of rapamycin complex subunit LST8 n=1 Tax=Anaeramoeba flamelloides TaxID=1746091 RepID=A0ABQ8Z1S6_9EUKA|nr:target of rapamycin complex subunit lst8 [Anaeramoeba flamelloides]